MKKDNRLDDDCDVKNTLPSYLRPFISSNSERMMIKFIKKIDGFYTKDIFYSHTDSLLYIERKYWNVLHRALLVGRGLRQGKNDYENGGRLNGLFLAPKVKCCFTINENSIIQQHLIFKVFNDGERLLDPSYVFNKLEGKKISAMLPRSWKKIVY